MWLRGDREFPFDYLEIFHSGEGVKYFSALEEKFRTSKRPCNFLFSS